MSCAGQVRLYKHIHLLGQLLKRNMVSKEAIDCRTQASHMTASLTGYCLAKSKIYKIKIENQHIMQMPSTAKLLSSKRPTLCFLYYLKKTLCSVVANTSLPSSSIPLPSRHSQSQSAPANQARNWPTRSIHTATPPCSSPTSAAPLL
jgi:hypothetical protein